MSQRDTASFTDRARAGLEVVPRDVMNWGPVHIKAELFYGRHWKNPDGSTNTPDLVASATGNLLVRGGASLLWEYAKGNGSTASTAAKKYLNATCALGVGNSTAAAANTQTALQGGSQLLKAMSAGYPTHTTGSTASTAAIAVFKTTYTTTQANFAWNEWGIFNKATTANRRMVNRKQQALITKTTAATATLTATITLS